jgi:hypothetical protein
MRTAPKVRPPAEMRAPTAPEMSAATTAPEMSAATAAPEMSAATAAPEMTTTAAPVGRCDRRRRTAEGKRRNNCHH